MSRDTLMQIIGAQTAAIDVFLNHYSRLGVHPPRDVYLALREIQRLAEAPVIDLAQNLVTATYEVDA